MQMLDDFKSLSMNFDREPELREKALFIVLLFISIFIFLDLLWQPISENIALKKKNLTRMEGQVANIRNIISSTKKQLEQKKDVHTANVEDSYLEKVLNRQILDVADEVNSIVGLLGSPLVAKRVKILKIDVGAHNKGKSYTEVPITVDMKGRYILIRDYLRRLENIGRPLLVDTFSMKKKNSKSSMLTVIIKMRLLVPKT